MHLFWRFWFTKCGKKNFKKDVCSLESEQFTSIRYFPNWFELMHKTFLGTFQSWSCRHMRRSNWTNPGFHISRRYLQKLKYLCFHWLFLLMQKSVAVLVSFWIKMKILKDRRDVLESVQYGTSANLRISKYKIHMENEFSLGICQKFLLLSLTQNFLNLKLCCKDNREFFRLDWLQYFWLFFPCL
jgi:hypothetical protein